MNFDDLMREAEQPSTELKQRQDGKAVRRSRRETVILKAELEGLKVVYGQPDMLLLDVDAGTVDLEAVLEMLATFRTPLLIREVRHTESRNGNDHLYVRTDLSLSRVERVLLQGLFGDPKRALLDWLWTRQEGLENGKDECFLIEVPRTRPERIDLGDYETGGREDY